MIKKEQEIFIKDQENNLVILAFLSAMIFGLASFVVWLLQ